MGRGKLHAVSDDTIPMMRTALTSCSFSALDTKDGRFERDTWPYLNDLAISRPGAGVHFQKCVIYSRTKDAESATAKWANELLSPNPWFRDLLPDFRNLPKSELPPGVGHATSFRSVCINTAIYLPWLVSKCLANGVTFRRATCAHVLDAGKLCPGTDIVINCTGLGARKLGGVEDLTVVPARGQIVLVRNETGGVMCDISGTDDGEDEASYIMTRAAGGGTVLGGCYQKGSWESQPDPSLAVRIMQRAVRLCPQLTNGKGIEALDVVRHGVGLRPVREGGCRVESETIDGLKVVHNYGSGGAGYQHSWGAAKEVVRLVNGL